MTTRREFLYVAGGVAALTLASACAPRLPGVTGPGPTSSSASSVFPTFVANTTGPKPDSPSSGPGYDDGFNSYPTNPVKAMAGDPPGTGSTIRAMSIALFPPPTPLPQNPAWQAVNKALNATMQIEVVTQADYPVKLATVMAGTDLPDIIYLYAPAGAASTLAAASGMPQFLQSQAADLTPYLGGDAARDYPNLAAIPTQAWKNAGCAYQGHLYLVPIHRYFPGQMFVKNVDVWDTELGKDYAPKNAD